MRTQRNRITWCVAFGVVATAALVAAPWGHGSEGSPMTKSLASATNAQDARDPWKRVPVATTASFRGLSAVTADIVWASGTRGTVIRTVDGGKTWAVRTVAGAENQDFRGIRAFDADSAIIMSTGNAEKGLARIYRTSDGGQNWTLVFETKTTGVFFDSIAFWDLKRGVVLSDPVDGHFVLFRTDDGGTTWMQIPPASLPSALKGEGSFAASNSCIALQGEKNIWFVTGGASVARVVRSNDGGETWDVAETPIRPANGNSGLFSVAFGNATIGFAVGGDYEQPTNTPMPDAIGTEDGGKTWHELIAPAEKLFFSSAVFVPPAPYKPNELSVTGAPWQEDRPSLLAVGPAGAASFHGGVVPGWIFDSKEGFNAVAAPTAQAAWAVGPKGFVARWSNR
jgi:photosystem II stability/assembly factor-like uncharacterized protein